MIYFDTETCGLHGPIILIQWAEDDGPVEIHNVFKSTVGDSKRVIEDIIYNEVCGFNLSFDWFHMCQTHSTLKLLPENMIPEDHLDEYAIAEEKARWVCDCIKPQAALDLMLHARKGPYQSTMDRKDIRIKRVPTALADRLAKELGVRIPMKDVYFARKNDSSKRWSVVDVHDDLGELIPDFKDIVLKFAPSSALKALANDALGHKTTTLNSIGIDKKFQPVELGYAPYAMAVGSPAKWNGAWPDLHKIDRHIAFWTHNSLAIRYAEDDVIYTRQLHRFFTAVADGMSDPDAREYALSDSNDIIPLPPGDDDSELACMVGAVRWSGFDVDLDKIKAIKHDAEAILAGTKFNINSPAVCKKYIHQVLDDTEKVVVTGTSGIVLEELSRWRKTELCEKCEGIGCDDCEHDGMRESDELHEAAIRAREILDARKCGKKIELCDKLITAGRFHASFKVIGTLSSRMSGTDGLNAQGIVSSKEVRECFTLGPTLCGGDFESFEMCIMDAVYHDERIHETLTGDKKIHALWGSKYFFPGLSYQDILDTKEFSGDKDKYTRSKNGVFAICYFGEGHTLITRVGIPQQIAEEAYHNILKDHPDFAEKRKTVIEKFCSMKQPGGIGSRVEWHEPDDYIETLLGFRRYFTLENKICKALFELAEEPPADMQNIKFKVVRRDREQTACGALRTALFAAAFAVQSANMRAAGNHKIQGTGAQITKGLQRRIWDLQPYGITTWKVKPMNIHDEVMSVTNPYYIDEQRKVVHDYVDSLKSVIPLISIDWSDRIKSWAEK